MAAQKLGPLSALEYVGPLPGLAELQVVEVRSASEPPYTQMLAHIAASRVIGADLEPADTVNGERAVAIISLMVPAATGQGKHWPDTVYIVDLVAAGLLSYERKADINMIKQSRLMRGLAGVLQDQGILVAICDCSWDAVALKECCGISVSAIDVQACWMLLVQAGVKSSHKDQHMGDRVSLKYMLGQYGLLHPNKDDVKALNRNLAQDGVRGRFFAAPRPLNSELLNYAASDARYLPALALLMERDMLRAYPGRLMQELQQQLKSKFFKKKGRDGSLYLGTTLHQLLAGWMGPVSVLSAAEETDRLAESTTAANRGTNSNRLLTLPDAFDTRASAFLFQLQMPTPAAGSQPQYDSSSMQAGYTLLVPHAALSAAQAAAAGVSTLADGGTEASAQQQQGQESPLQQSLQQQQQQELVLQTSGAWQPDEASNGVMSILGTGLSKKVENDVRLRIKQLSKQYDPDSLQQLQLRELFVLPGGKIKYCLATDSILASVPAAATTAAGAAAQGAVLSSRFKRCYEVAGGGNTLGDQQLLEACLERLAIWNGWTEHEIARELLNTTQSSLFIKGTLHRVVPITMHSNTQQQPSSSSRSIAPRTSSEHGGDDRRSSRRSSTGRTSSSEDAEAVQGTTQHAQAVAAEAATILSEPLAAAAAAAPAGDGSVVGLHFYVERTQPGLSLVLADALAGMAVAAGSIVSPHQQPLQQAKASSRSSRSSRSSSSSSGSSSTDHNSPPVQTQGTGLEQWSLGLGSFLVPTATAAAAAATAPAGSTDLIGSSPWDSPVDVVPGHLLLLFGPQRSGKSSMLWDAAQQLSGGWGCNVALIDIQGIASPQCGTALHLPASSPDAQAAAITAAWQQHGCRVVVCEHIDASAAVVQAVQAALAAGCSVVAAAQGVAALAGAAGHAAAAAAASQEGYQPGDLSVLADGRLASSGSSSSNSVQPAEPPVTQAQPAIADMAADLQPTVPQQQQQQQQQGHAGVVALWRLVVQLAQQRPGDCTLVDCHRTYRWHIHCNLQQTMNILQQASNQSSSTSAGSQLAGFGRGLSGSAIGYVLPVEVREFVHAQSVLGQAAAVIDGSGVRHSPWQDAVQQAQQQQQQQQQQEEEEHEEEEGQHSDHRDNAQDARQQDGSMPADNGAERHDTSPVVVARFSTYGAAAAVLPGGLQECVRRLLHPERDS